ncbi:MAG: hypothetical protein HZA35_04065 [Parcubacteria group bacterium]|nr:hypothetical protein [Parcubacteria group bacterium]
MDIPTIVLVLLLGWIIGTTIARQFMPKLTQCESELIWRCDPSVGTYEPDLEKDFDTRFESCLFRIKMSLPPFEFESHKNAVLTILNQQKYRLKWILNELENTIKVQCIFMTLVLATDRAKNLLLMVSLAGISLEKTAIDLSHKNIFYKIDVGGNIEIMP